MEPSCIPGGLRHTQDITALCAHAPILWTRKQNARVSNSTGGRAAVCWRGQFSFLSFLVSSLCRRNCKDFKARVRALASFQQGELEQVLNLQFLQPSKRNHNTFLIGVHEGERKPLGAQRGWEDQRQSWLGAWHTAGTRSRPGTARRVCVLKVREGPKVQC